MSTITLQNIKFATAEQLDAIIERTEYVANGIPVTDAAESDLYLRRAAIKEIEALRFGFDQEIDI